MGEYRSRRMNKTPEKERCPQMKDNEVAYYYGIQCDPDQRNCDKCGWNELVALRRKNEILKKML